LQENQDGYVKLLKTNILSLSLYQNYFKNHTWTFTTVTAYILLYIYATHSSLPCEGIYITIHMKTLTWVLEKNIKLLLLLLLLCTHQKKNISQLITSMQCWPSVLWESLSLNIHHNSLVLNSKTETRMYTASFSSSHYQQKYLRTYVRYTHWKKNIKHSLNIKKKKNTHYIIYYIYESSRIKS
jgi:hypothetical protein